MEELDFGEELFNSSAPKKDSENSRPSVAETVRIDDEDEFLYGIESESSVREKVPQEDTSHPIGEEDIYGQLDSTNNFEVPTIQEPIKEENQDDDDEDEEDVQIVLNAESVEKGIPPPAGRGRGLSFARVPSTGGPGSMMSPSSGSAASPSLSRASISVPIVRQQPQQIAQHTLVVPAGQSQKNIYDINIDELEDKPWRKPGQDITDYFNYGFNEESWKAYCAKQVSLRLEQSMQGKIKVYQSRNEGGVNEDLPPELQQFSMQMGSSEPPLQQFHMPLPPALQPPQPPPMKKQSGTLGPQRKVQVFEGTNNDQYNRPAEHRRRMREQDDSVIQVLAGEDDGSEESAEEEENMGDSPGAMFGGVPPDFRGAPSFMVPMLGGPPPHGRYPPPGRGPPPYDRYPPRDRDSRDRERDRRGFPPRDGRPPEGWRPPREDDRRREEEFRGPPERLDRGPPERLDRGPDRGLDRGPPPDGRGPPPERGGPERGPPESKEDEHRERKDRKRRDEPPRDYPPRGPPPPPDFHKRRREEEEDRKRRR